MGRFLTSRPPIVRMFQIHAALADGESVNCSTLALRLETCPKTIYRDLNFMRDRLRLPLTYHALNRTWRYTRVVRHLDDEMRRAVT